MARVPELTMRIALTGMFNVINQALGIEMEDGLPEGADSPANAS